MGLSQTSPTTVKGQRATRSVLRENPCSWKPGWRDAFSWAALCVAGTVVGKSVRPEGVIYTVSVREAGDGCVWG